MYNQVAISHGAKIGDAVHDLRNSLDEETIGSFYGGVVLREVADGVFEGLRPGGAGVSGSGR